MHLLSIESRVSTPGSKVWRTQAPHGSTATAPHALISDHLTEPRGAHGLPRRGATTHPFGEVIYVSTELIEENHDTH
ncbi:MAG TPA: hypothetical protein VGC05_00715 [Mycobacterium sp.]